MKMMNHFKKTEGLITVEGHSRIMFGIEVDGRLYPDITGDEAKIDELIKLCNHLELDPAFLDEVLDDFMDEQYTLTTTASCQ